jgi:hypothetical protein
MLNQQQFALQQKIQQLEYNKQLQEAELTYRLIELLQKDMLSAQEQSFLLNGINASLNNRPLRFRKYNPDELHIAAKQFITNTPEAAYLSRTWCYSRFDPKQRTLLEKTAPLALTTAKIATAPTLVEKMESGLSILQMFSKK